ncbi:MAG: hypothetical protein J6I49_09395 [Bacteroidales bacterium]|nr:hypothetical protein [Bacteroidales bacterium]
MFMLLPRAPEYNSNIGYKHHYVVHHGAQIKTLIMGHSHFENGLNPHQLGDSAFNLSSAGRPFYYDIEILRQYLPQMPNVKTIIYPLRYRLSDNDFFKERFRQGLFEDYYLNWNLQPPPEYADCFKRPIRWIPHYRKYQSDHFNVDSLGYVIDWSTPQTMSEIETHILTTQSEDTAVIRYLEEVSKICENNGIRLIVLAAPQSNLFLDHVTEAGVNRMDAVISEVCKNHHILYHNYMYDLDFRDDTLYRDWTHLNHTGATLFAQRVREDFNL